MYKLLKIKVTNLSINVDVKRLYQIKEKVHKLVD